MLNYTKKIISFNNPLAPPTSTPSNHHTRLTRALPTNIPARDLSHRISHRIIYPPISPIAANRIQAQRYTRTLKFPSWNPVQEHIIQFFIRSPLHFRDGIIQEHESDERESREDVADLGAEVRLVWILRLLVCSTQRWRGWIASYSRSDMGEPRRPESRRYS